MRQPIVEKEYHFIIAEAKKDAECIQLISQVMESYNDLSALEKCAIAHWFYEKYRNL